MDDLFWDVEVIDNWEEKMKELTTPEQKRFYPKMIGKIEELKEFAHGLEGWSQVLRDDQKTIKVDAIYHKSNGCSTLKAEMWFDFSATDIWRILHFDSLRSKWDHQSDIFDFKEKIGPGGFYAQSRS